METFPITKNHRTELVYNIVKPLFNEDGSIKLDLVEKEVKRLLEHGNEDFEVAANSYLFFLINIIEMHGKARLYINQGQTEAVAINFETIFKGYESGVKSAVIIFDYLFGFRRFLLTKDKPKKNVNGILCFSEYASEPNFDVVYATAADVFASFFEKILKVRPQFTVRADSMDIKLSIEGHLFEATLPCYIIPSMFGNGYAITVISHICYMLLSTLDFDDLAKKTSPEVSSIVKSRLNALASDFI